MPSQLQPHVCVVVVVQPGEEMGWMTTLPPGERSTRELMVESRRKRLGLGGGPRTGAPGAGVGCAGAAVGGVDTVRGDWGGTTGEPDAGTSAVERRMSVKRSMAVV